MIPVSRKRLVTTTLGVILAVAIIFSTFTVGNNQSKVTVFQSIADMNYHIMTYCSINGSKLGDVVGEIENASHIDSVMGDAQSDLFSDNLSLTLVYFHGMKYPSLMKGRYPEGPFEIDISFIFSDQHNLNVGDRIEFPYDNITLTVVGVLSSAVNIEYQNSNNIASMTSPSFALTSLSTLKHFQDVSLTLAVKLDPDYLIASQNTEELNGKIVNAEEKIFNILTDADASQIRINAVEPPSQTSFAMVGLLIFALPVIVMGAYLSKVGIEIELLERRKEFGILRIRGATNSQRFKLLLWEAILYGVVGGIIGYPVGEGVAYLSNITLFKYPFFFMDFGWVYLVSAMVISISLFFMALYAPWKKISRTSLIDLISHYSQKFKKPEYRAEKDIILVIFLWVYLILGIYLLLNYDETQGLTLITLLAGIMMISLIFMFPLILIYLPLATTRLITLGFPRIYEVVASGISRFMRASGEIVRKSVRRNPKNIAHLAFILAFLLTLSTFISVTVDTQRNFTEIDNALSVGGDFAVSSKLNLTLLQKSRNVSSYVAYSLSDGIYYGEHLNTVFLNFRNYTRTVYPLDYFIKRGSLGSGGIAITESMARKYHLKVGDTIDLGFHISVFGPEINDEVKYHKYRIGCIMYVFPGITDSEVMINRNVNHSEMSGVIIKARDYQALKGQLNSMGVYYVERDEKNDSGMTDFTILLLVYILALGASSIFVIQYSLYLNRRGEMALYRVRGAKRRQGIAILMAEGTTVIVLSLIIGIIVGGALAYFVAVLMQYSSHIPIVYSFGYYFALATVILTGIFLLSQYIISMKFAMVNVNEIIREIGGEM